MTKTKLRTPFTIFSFQGDSASFFYPLAGKGNPEKVVRIFQESRKLDIFKDPLVRDKFEYDAGVLGISFDHYLNKYLDHVVEFLLNRSDLSQALKDKIILGAQISSKDLFIFNGLYQIFRFRKLKLKKSDSSPNYLFQKVDKSITITLRLPEKLLLNLSDVFSKKSCDFTIQDFVRKIFDDFLNANSIFFKTGLEASGYQRLERQIAELQHITIWKPFGFKSPPILHSSDEMDNQFTTFTDLIEQSHQRLESTKSFLSKKVIFTIRSKRDDPLKEYIFYLSDRLWRNPGTLLSLLILQNYRDWDREGFLYDSYNSKKKPLKSVSKFVEFVMSR